MKSKALTEIFKFNHNEKWYTAKIKLSLQNLAIGLGGSVEKQDQTDINFSPIERKC